MHVDVDVDDSLHTEEISFEPRDHGVPSQEVPPFWHFLMENIGRINTTMECMN